MPGRRLSDHRAALALAALVVASTAVRFAASLSFDVPWIAPDEEIYALLGRSLWETGTFEILGAPAPYYSALYPALAGVPLCARRRRGRRRLAPACPGARHVLSRGSRLLLGADDREPSWALAAASLTLLLPALAFTGLVMSETLFFVVTTWALWALARTLERPTLGRQAVLAIAVAAAVSTRLQAIVLVPAIVAAVALAAVFARSREPLRRFAPTFALLAAGAVAWVAFRAVEGGSWQEVLGAYATVAEQEYSFGLAAKYVAWHVADVFLLVLGVPLLALTAVAVPALRGREADAAVRAFLSVAIAYVALLVVEVGVFASRFVGHLAERQLVTAAPPLFLALALWLHRGAPRPQPWTSVAAVLVAVPVVLLPVGELVIPEAAPDGFLTIPLARLASWTSDGAMEAVYVGGAALVLLLFVLLPRRWAPALLAAVAVGLVGASVVVASEVSELSRRERQRVFGAGDPRWIDRAADGPVSFLWVGERFWPAVWEHLFWNRRIGEVLRLPDQEMPGPVPQRPVAPRFDGVVYDTDRPRSSRRACSSPRARSSSPASASRSCPQRRTTTRSCSGGPSSRLRVSTWATGILPNGDLHGPRARAGLRLRPRPTRADADREGGAAVADPAGRPRGVRADARFRGNRPAGASRARRREGRHALRLRDRERRPAWDRPGPSLCELHRSWGRPWVVPHALLVVELVRLGESLDRVAGCVDVGVRDEDLQRRVVHRARLVLGGHLE